MEQRPTRAELSSARRDDARNQRYYESQAARTRREPTRPRPIAGDRRPQGDDVGHLAPTFSTAQLGCGGGRRATGVAMIVLLVMAPSVALAARASVLGAHVGAGLGSNGRAPLDRETSAAFGTSTRGARAILEATASPVVTRLRANHKVWTTTYWPVAASAGNPDGDPERHLWAKNGALDKLDRHRAQLGLPKGALETERRPLLAWLVDANAPAGYFIPSPMLEESDFERTTGVDLNGNKKLDPKVVKDFLTSDERFETNGRTTDTADVSWWGECDKVALAGQIFKEPKKSVKRGDITFTPQDIKAFLTLIAPSQVRGSEMVLDRFDDQLDQVRTTAGASVAGRIEGLDIRAFRSGSFYREGDFIVRVDYPKPITLRFDNGTTQFFPVNKFWAIARESELDSPAAFHDTVKKWMGEKRPFSMDHDRGKHVWNDNYDGANFFETPQVPAGTDVWKLDGVAGPYKGGKLNFVTAEVLKGEETAQTYRYWLESKDGRVVNSGWMEDSNSPDFLHRPVLDAPSPTFTGYNPRNPFVAPELIGPLYRESIG